VSFQFRAHDVRGLERAAGECNPIALVAGPNAAGKTSLAQAIAAALTGDALPVEGMTKGTAGLFVRAGTGIGRVEIASDQGTASITWPAAQIVREGKAPEASEYAAGLSSVVTMAPRDRARVLSEYLRADPTFEDLQAELADQGWPDETIAAVWKLIEQQGWDKAHALRKDRGAELKGRWRQITGLNYGSRIAANWRPDLADPSLNEPELMAAVARAQADHDAAVSAAAVSRTERERLTDEADQFDARSGDALKAERTVAERAEALHVAQQGRIALPPVEQAPTMPCPHCGAAIVVNRVNLVELRLEKPVAVPPSEVDVKQRRMAIGDAEGKLAYATDALNMARRAEADARAAVERSRAAKERIANWPAATETGTDIEAAKLALSRAEKRLSEFRMKGEADDINEKIESNEIVLDLLAGDGLRARKLNKVRAVFVEKQLRALTDEAGWKRVDIDADMALRYDGRPYGMLSSSEQYRVAAVLQLAMACLDGSDAVIVDGADILDAPARSGLFAMLDASGVSALVAMTLSRRDQVPDLEAAGLGQSYWLAGGVLEPARQAKEAA
jgi:hypothetical protein